MHYSNLRELLRGDPEARHYFDILPDYAQDQIVIRAGNINSFANLKDYAQNILRGDD